MLFCSWSCTRRPWFRHCNPAPHGVAQVSEVRGRDRQTATPELGSRLLLVLLLVMSPSRPLLGGCAGTYYDPLAASSRASGVRGEPNDKQGHTTCRECLQLQLQLVGREYLGSQWHCSYVPVPVPVAGPEVGYPSSIEISSPWHGVRCRYQQPGQERDADGHALHCNAVLAAEHRPSQGACLADNGACRTIIGTGLTTGMVSDGSRRSRRRRTPHTGTGQRFVRHPSSAAREGIPLDT